MIFIPGEDGADDDNDDDDDDDSYFNLVKETSGELEEYMDDVGEMGSDQYPGFRKVMII
jgi:hypothetical protein